MAPNFVCSKCSEKFFSEKLLRIHAACSHNDVIQHIDHPYGEETGSDQASHAQEGHAQEGLAQEDHAHEGQAQEGHAQESHAQDGHAQESLAGRPQDEAVSRNP